MPNSDDVHFQPGDGQALYIPTTHGLLISPDDGGSFYWICNEAIVYAPPFEPDIAVSASGVIFSTSYNGTVVSRDGGCSWDALPAPVSDAFTGDIELDAMGRLWVATAGGGMVTEVYRSDDEGMSFTAVGPGDSDVVWVSLRAAPSDPNRLYLTGFTTSAPTTPVFYRTDNAGQYWTALALGAIDPNGSNNIYVMAIAPSNPNLVFVAAGPSEDSVLYRSIDGGDTWSSVLEMTDAFRSVVIRDNGTSVIAATILAGVRSSANGGVTWAPTTEQPEMACLGERSDGELFACGSNWDPDLFMIGRSSDGQTWQKIARLSDITSPLDCPEGTVQHDTCELVEWDNLCATLQLEACAEPGVDGDPTEPTEPEGCCQSAEAGPRTLVFSALMVFLVLLQVVARRKQ